jgi:hypothetical protein
MSINFVGGVLRMTMHLCHEQVHKYAVSILLKARRLTCFSDEPPGFSVPRN